MKIQILLFLIISIMMMGCIPNSECLLFNIDENAAMSIIKAAPSINPQGRKKIDEVKLSPAEVSKLLRSLNDIKERRVAFVSCNYYLNFGSGRTIGIIINTKNKCVEAFDMGRNMNSIEVHSRSIRPIRVIKGIEQGKELYNLIMKKFQNEVSE